MKKIIGLILSLTVISAVCAGVLAYVNEQTKDAIRETAEKNRLAAREAVLCGEKGHAVEGVSHDGYGGDIVLMVGFREDRTPSREVIRAEGLVIGYTEPLTRPLDLLLLRGEKTAVKGVNGLGKTTLLRTLLGQIAPLAGSVQTGDFLSVGYFEQEDEGGSETALENIMSCFPDMSNGEARAALARMGLTREHITSQVRVLSGGEQAKVRLCRLMNRECNFLVLDEPTNHLDAEAKAELARALNLYRGTVLLVSHEPEFYADFVTRVINLEEYTTKIV